jgi:hypothetical protein
MRETARAKAAWADYLALGPDRSLEKLAERYRSVAEVVPTRRLNTLKAWSAAFGWQARLEEIADQAAREAEEKQAAYRREILETGFAAAHERVKALKDLAVILEDELHEDDKRWVQDVKQIGGGENAREVFVEKFNAAEVEQFRGLLDDIAKEKGERRQQHDHKVELEVKKELEAALDRLRANLDPDAYARVLAALAASS